MEELYLDTLTGRVLGFEAMRLTKLDRKIMYALAALVLASAPFIFVWAVLGAAREKKGQEDL